jgi:predicted Zn-dependent peptidase
VPPVFAPLAAKVPPFIVREMNTLGAWVFVAYRTPGPAVLSSVEYAALKVLAAALDGSSQSRLRRRLIPSDELASAAKKSKEVAGQVAAQLTSRRWSNEVIVFAQTDPQNVDSVKNALLDEVAKLSSAPLSLNELQSAKRFARGQWAAGREQARERAFEAGAAALFGTKPDSQWPVLIEAVTAVQVQQVAKKYLGAYAVVLIMPESP